MFHEPERKDFRQIRFLRYPLHVQHGDCYPLPMSTTITPRAKNFPQWYQDVIAKTPDLVDDAPVTGAITFGPLAVKMWENIRGSFDKAIKTLGVENIMVPGLIPEHFFQREKEHIEGFSPEVAVVTHAGGEKLAEPYYVRPTSELLFVDWFSRAGRVQSHRDLPLLANQWGSVMRWEKRPRAFLRTSEFHWQEGHCLFATEDECRTFTLKILDLYARLSEELLAVPVIKGEKPAHERFPGAINTYSIEGMMQDGKALQMGTSHVLNQDFLKETDGRMLVSFLDEKGERRTPFYDSWGISTRLLGAVIMTHGDDDGLVLPARLAPVTTMIVPIFAGNEKDNEQIISAARALAAAITKNEEEPVKVHGRKDSFEELCFASKDRLHQSVMIDARQGLRLGEKTFHAIHAGIPVRVELGAKELKEKKCVIKSRIRQREDAVTVTLDEAPDVIHEMLATDHQKLFAHALQRMQSRIVRPKDFKELKTAINDGNFVEIPWDGTKETVEKLKEETSGGTIRCFAFDAKEDARTDNDPVSQKPSAFAKRVLVGKAY